MVVKLLEKQTDLEGRLERYKAAIEGEHKKYEVAQ